MRFLFTSAQLEAHLDWGGFLATAACLVRRGHEVLWVSGAAVGERVRSEGVSFRPVEETGWRWPPPPPLTREPAQPVHDFERQRNLRSLDQWLDVERVSSAIDSLAPVLVDFRPDVIVSEVFLAAAALAAERAGIPFAVAGWPAHAGEPPLLPGIEEARLRLDLLLERQGLQGVNFARRGPPSVQSPFLHLTYWSGSWYGDLPLLEQTRHCGGRAPAYSPRDASLPEPEAQPWVWITLGTTFGEDPDFFRMATQAAHNLGCLPIVATGSKAAEVKWLADAPAETIVKERIDFGSVLPWTSAGIHHGGAGATHALVTHAVPQIVVPRAGDQARQAAGVRRTGVGAALAPAEVTVQRLTDVLAAILPDRSPFRVAANALRKEFASLGGADAAADLLEKLPGAYRERTGTAHPQ